ncbi:MAG: helix-turn-helix transcriptional regulator [Lachnospiraceae bacterium]|nr:helix-turn-helix transcriptional regulator [Lachnospiraceae bacterium]
MESFGEYIKQYLDIRNISYSNAAKMCKIDRTSLGRYAKGNRKLPSRDIITKLSDGLHMSPQEKKELYEAYKRTKISEKYHTDYTILSSIINEKHMVRKKVDADMIQGIAANFTPDMSCELYGENSLIEAINYVKKGAKYIKMYFSPHQFEQNENFVNVFWDMKGIVHREQIICLEHREWLHGEEKMRNINCLLPFLLQREQTTVYYYYQRANKNAHEEIKKYYLITDKGIVFFNKKLSRGFFSSQSIPCAYYENSFDRMKAKCRIFAEGGIETFQKSKSQSVNEKYENEESGILFFGQKENGCIWIMKKDSALAVCIKEAGSAHLLWEFIWNGEDEGI